MTDKYELESNPIVETDNMGRNIFWQDTEDESLAVKIFSDSVCSNCSCK